MDLSTAILPASMKRLGKSLSLRVASILHTASMEYTEFEDFIRQSTAYLRACNKKAERHFGIGDYARYAYDLHRREVWWSDPDGPKVRGRVTIVGTISTISNTWLWSWANPHFNDLDLGQILEVKKFGEQETITKLIEAKWEAEEVDGWEMTCVAARLLEAQGAYRPPCENGPMFLLFDNLEFIPEDEAARYAPLKGEAVARAAEVQASTTECSLGQEGSSSTHSSSAFASPPTGSPTTNAPSLVDHELQRLAIITLLAGMLFNIMGSVWAGFYGQVIPVLLVWGFLVWKIATQPRKWSLFVGAICVLAIFLQVFLWVGAPARLGEAYSIWLFLPYSLTLFLSAVFCFRLRVRPLHLKSSVPQDDQASTQQRPGKNFKLKKEDIKKLIEPMGACFASDHIMVDGLPIHYMYREEPDFEVDSGWRFLSGKETEAYNNDPDHLGIYDVNTIANYDPAIIAYLHLPIGTHLERDHKTNTFVPEPPAQ